MQITDRFQDNDFIRNSQLNDFVAAICDYKNSLDFKRAQRYRWHLKFKKEILLLKSFEFRLLFPYRWRCAYQNKRKTLFWFILVFRSKSRPIRSVFFFFIFFIFKVTWGDPRGRFYIMMEKKPVHTWIEFSWYERTLNRKQKSSSQFSISLCQQQS